MDNLPVVLAKGCSSHQRRFSRWFAQPRIEMSTQALQSLDSASAQLVSLNYPRLIERFNVCGTKILIRLSIVQYRGRAISVAE